MIDRSINCGVGASIDGWMDADRKINGQADRQADRQTDRRVDGREKVGRKLLRISLAGESSTGIA